MTEADKTAAPAKPKAAKKSAKLGQFRAAGRAFYKNKRVEEGHTFTITDEKDWRPWMVPVTEKPVVPRSPFPESMIASAPRTNP